MEKRTPHCRLSRVKALILAGKVRVTGAATASARALGIDVQGMLRVVALLTAADFHKSMTIYADHRIWQDVYRPVTRMGQLYVKLVVIDDVLIVSFKEL